MSEIVGLVTGKSLVEGPKEGEGLDICPRNLIRALSPMQEIANMQLLPL